MPVRQSTRNEGPTGRDNTTTKGIFKQKADIPVKHKELLKAALCCEGRKPVRRTK
jgi:hypothetical protein